MTRQEAVDWIRATNGRLFSIKFIKRSTGSVREMTCRIGVKRDLSQDPDKSKIVDFKSAALIPVFDMQADAYKSIPVEGITEVKIDGVWVKVI